MRKPRDVAIGPLAEFAFYGVTCDDAEDEPLASLYRGDRDIVRRDYVVSLR